LQRTAYGPGVMQAAGNQLYFNLVSFSLIAFKFQVREILAFQ